MYLTAKGTYMKMETRYHATRTDIAAEEAEIESARKTVEEYKAKWL